VLYIQEYVGGVVGTPTTYHSGKITCTVAGMILVATVMTHYATYPPRKNGSLNIVFKA
jgi:hypothetical protein